MNRIIVADTTNHRIQAFAPQTDAEGEGVATVFDLDTTFGVIPVFDCFQVSNGLLKQIRPYYDPRLITEATK